MIFLFFKVLRKLKLFWNQIVLKSRLCSYYYLSKRRFQIHKTFSAGSLFSIQSDLSNAIIFIKENVSVRNNFKIHIGHSGKITIGVNCFFNNNCSINCLGSIEMGNDNQFGENVLFYDHNHRHGDVTQLISQQGYSIGKIVIGNNCWIGSNVVILKDVNIGDNSVIGAGCIIHKSIPANSVVMNQQNLIIKPRNESGF